MSAIECNCDPDGSEDTNPDGSDDANCDDAGKCFCKPGFAGDKCVKCAKGFSGFPNCKEDTSLTLVLTTIMILIVILVLLFVFGYRRYFFQLLI